tara:strand:+ start:590 stop:1342 length:753 start_codon:yes stop_codon:yes gene_type:complete
MAQTINLGKPINPISDLENIGLGKRIFLVGNGPSLNDMNLDLLENEYSIAMNRIELIYPKTTWRPTWYMFCSSNCEGSQWGDKWSRSILNASNEEKTTPLIWSRYKNAIEKNGGGSLPEKTIYLNSFSEHSVGQDNCFSTNAWERLDKSGTSMNVALQLAYYMNFSEVYIIGCDSNWVTATDTINTGDKNHFHEDYHAFIGDGSHEFWRMNTTHQTAKKFFDEKGTKIMNAGYNSAITAYEKINFESLFN